jgi:hypothetical protein
MEKAFPTVYGLQQAIIRSLPGFIAPRETPMKYEQYDTIYPSHKASSWMPVDTTSHWHWNNPLNLLLALPVLMLVLSLLVSL